MRRLLALGAAVLGAAAGSAAASAGPQCPPAPRPEAAFQWVAEAMVFNGLPMQILRFDAKQTVDQVLAFYRSHWNGKGPQAPIEYPLGPWQVISAARGRCFYTVQVQAAGKGSTGFVAASDVSQLQAARVVKPLPMMTGSSLVNDIEHRDPGKSGRTVLLTNGFSPEANADFYRRHLGDEGWKSIQTAQTQTPKGPGITMVMKRELAELSLVIARHGETTSVLANFMDNP